MRLLQQSLRLANQGPPKQNLLAYFKSTVDSIGLSVSDYDSLTTAQQAFFFADASTPNTWADFDTFWTAISAETWFNKTNNVIESETKGVAIYDKQAAQSTLARARTKLGLSAITDFVMLWRTTGASESITLPTRSGYTYNATVDWGDGNTSTITSYDDADITHTYASAGDYTVSISGTFPSFYFNNGGDKDKLIEVSNLGDTGWLAVNLAFYGCSNLIYFRAGHTDTSQVTNMGYMMYGWSSMTSPPDLSSFDTSQVTDMGNMMRNWSL